jgi:ADP-L-glycero-D-manno-heptose 6-epimerase
MILVTGAAGFIGSCLLEAITEPTVCADPAGYNMLAPEEAIAELQSSKDISCVYHLGAISSTTETNSVKLTENNILYSLRILEVCIIKQIPFIYASSASVYGAATGIQSESQLLAPINAYASSKSALDYFVQLKIDSHPDAHIIGLRYFNVFGHREHHKGDMASPVHKFTIQGRKTGKIKIFEGSSEFQRDFIHIDDVVAMTLAAPNLKSSGIYNVGTGAARSFQDVAEIIAAATGAVIEEIPFPQHLKGKYQKYTCSDNHKISMAGYNEPRQSLEEGIRKTLALI